MANVAFKTTGMLDGYLGEGGLMRAAGREVIQRRLFPGMESGILRAPELTATWSTLEVRKMV